MSPHSAAMPTISSADARHALMYAQGLLDDPDRPTGAAAVRKLVERMGYVQLDSINVLERAHHLTLLTRSSHYRQDHLHQLHEKKRALFEHWTHDASLITTRFLPAWHTRRRRFMKGVEKSRWWKARMRDDADALIDRILTRIRDEGPVQSRDFEKQTEGSGAWWNWKPAKAMLEFLWWKGSLAVIARPSFQKVYDLMERAHPEHIDHPEMDDAEFIDWACRETMDRQVIATPAELADFFDAISIAEAKAWCAARVRSGELMEVRVEGTDDRAPRTAFALPDRESRVRSARRALARIDDRLRLLSPFDPVIRNRKRCEHYFGFEYRFEAFVPASKRTFGYYVLPILQQDRLIGRTDLKLHRDRETLEVRGLWWEPGVRATRRLERAFDDAIDHLAEFVGAAWIERST